MMLPDSSLEQRERRGDYCVCGDGPTWTPQQRGRGTFPVTPISAGIIAEDLPEGTKGQVFRDVYEPVRDEQGPRGRTVLQLA